MRFNTEVDYFRTMLALGLSKGPEQKKTNEPIDLDVAALMGQGWVEDNSDQKQQRPRAKGNL